MSAQLTSHRRRTQDLLFFLLQVIFWGIRLIKGKVNVKAESKQLMEWEREFDAAARNSLLDRMEYLFINTYKLELDNSKFRSFDSIAEYREWCRKNLPEYLGYR